MAKGSQFWGNASGKLGQQVLYRAGGEQRARMHVAKIKNPKTLAQMQNRLLMNNVVSAFRSVKGLFQETFPSRKSNQSAFNAFVQANKLSSGFYISKEDLEAGACVPFGLTIAKGTSGLQLTPQIMPLPNVFNNGGDPKYFVTVSGLLNLSDYTMKLKRADLGDPEIRLTPEQTFKVFSETCIVKLPSEFQVSVVGAQYGADDADPSTDIWQLGASITHCQQYNAYRSSLGMGVRPNGMDVHLHIASMSEEDSEGFVELTFDYVTLGLSYETAEDALSFPKGVVLSYKDANGQQVSTSKILPIPASVAGVSVEDPAADFRKDGFYYQQVLDAYGYKSSGVLASTAPNVESESSTPPSEEGGEDLLP